MHLEFACGFDNRDTAQRVTMFYDRDAGDCHFFDEQGQYIQKAVPIEQARYLYYELVNKRSQIQDDILFYNFIGSGNSKQLVLTFDWPYTGPDDFLRLHMMPKQSRACKEVSDGIIDCMYKREFNPDRYEFMDWWYEDAAPYLMIVSDPSLIWPDDPDDDDDDHGDDWKDET